MGREWKGHAESHQFGAALLALPHDAGQRARARNGIDKIAIGDGLQISVKRGRDGNGVSVHRESEGRDDRNLGATEPKAGGDRHRRQ